MDYAQKARTIMVKRQIAGRGIQSQLLIDAMGLVPREKFLPEALREFAYHDRALSISEGQTISEPYIIAVMIEALALNGGEKVLEVGTGSGYSAALLAEIANEVYSIERLGMLVKTSRAALANIGYDSVHVVHADGSRGWPAQAPYDAIMVAAAGSQIPAILLNQLKIGGRLVMPIGSATRAQVLVKVTRLSITEVKSEVLTDVHFDPLIGEQGWNSEDGHIVL